MWHIFTSHTKRQVKQTYSSYIRVIDRWTVVFVLLIHGCSAEISTCFSAQLAAASRIDQRASCVGLEGTGRTSRKPPPLLRSRTLPAIVVPGVNILQAQLGNYNQGKAGSGCQRIIVGDSRRMWVIKRSIVPGEL